MMELHFSGATPSCVAIGPDKQSLGSSPSCDIHLAGMEGVYPVHAHLWSVKDSIVISLKIGAKILVNGERLLLRATLHHGDLLKIGDVEAEVRESDIEMGFRDKINHQGLQPAAASNIQNPVLSRARGAANMAHDPIATPTALTQPVFTNAITEQSQSLAQTDAAQADSAPLCSTEKEEAQSGPANAISRQQLAGHHNEREAGLHLRDSLVPEDPPKLYSRSRKAISLLILAAGTLLFANLLLIPF